MKSKAVLLFSGGLDSSLSFKILEKDIRMYGIVFSTPFVSVQERVFNLAEEIGLPLIEENIGEEYFEILLHPEFGFGKGANPCLDCHIMMLKKAKEYMNRTGAEFIVTGEVMSQRMKSQKKRDFTIAEKKTGLEGLILRPLSAGLLPETIPEKEGIINRARLFSISGKSRKVQLELAKKFNLHGYSTPAGGCILADPSFSRRVKDAIAHGEITDEKVKLLKVGRHFRLANGSKLIIPRNEAEDINLRKLSANFILIEPDNQKGPGAVLVGDSDIARAVSFLARYSRKANKFSIVKNGGKTQMTAEPAAEEEIKKYLI